MRRVVVVVLMVVAGCRREPDFDNRYNVAANSIEQRAARIDQQLNASDTANSAD